MKTAINFTNTEDDTFRFSSAADLRSFYEAFGCSGLELLHFPMYADTLLEPEMILGIHTRCVEDWMHLERELLLKHYREDLDYARRMGAEYVVFHVTQVSYLESFTYQMEHTDEEVIDAACVFINELLDGQSYDFYFLMENLWWPGLNFLNPSATARLLAGVHYKKKGLMLDTGHYMHTDLSLETQKDALKSLHAMLDGHKDILPYIKGVHLHQSLTGSYVKDWLKKPLPEDLSAPALSAQIYEHIFAIDQHLPFTEPGVRELVARIDPLYLTYEYISRSREEHARFLKEGSRALNSPQAHE